MSDFDNAPIPVGPGRGWTPGEREILRLWFKEPTRLDVMLKCIRRWLGPFADCPIAEDIWIDFFHTSRSGLDVVIDGYSPNPRVLSFWKRLCSCFYKRDLHAHDPDRSRRRDGPDDFEPDTTPVRDILDHMYGSDWAEEDRRRILPWLEQPMVNGMSLIDYLKLFALDRLGERATTADAAVAWKRFLEPRTEWERTVDSFDPGPDNKRGFPNWLCRKLKHFSWSAAKKTRVEEKRRDKCRREVLRKWRGLEVVWGPDEGDPCHEAAAALIRDSEDEKAIVAAITFLKTLDRAVLTMHLVEGMKHKDIAKELKSTEGAIKARHRRAKESLADASEALVRFPEVQRRVLVMRHAEGRRDDQIAEELEMDPAEVRRLIEVAELRMREFMKRGRDVRRGQL